MSNTLKNAFINIQNVLMLWDIISENPTISGQSKSTIEEISQLFVSQTVAFFDKETVNNKSISLLDLNKRYMVSFIDQIKTMYTTKFVGKIKIHNEPSEPVTYQEIQKLKETEFNSRFNSLSKDFREANTLKVPDLPNFKDEYQDKPIVNMDENIKLMIQQRQYDVETMKPENDVIPNKKNVQFSELIENHEPDNQHFLNEIKLLKQRIQLLEEKLLKP